MDLFQGTVLVDGGFVDATNDGICLKPPTGSTVAVQVTSNGTIRIGGGGNFRIGNGRTGIGSAAGPNSTSQVDMNSGTVELYGSAVLYVGDNVAGAKGVFNQNGGLVWGSAGSANTLTIGNLANADGTYNLKYGCGLRGSALSRATWPTSPRELSFGKCICAGLGIVNRGSCGSRR
jgi:hypothetical protein